MRLPANPRVALVGATGAVGRVMLRVLQDRAFPHSELIAVASARSEGRQLPYKDGFLTVKALAPEVFEDIDLVLLDTPDEVALEWAPIAVSAGAIVVDNSAAWRMEPGVPLVVPEINAEEVHTHSGIIASPNCTTIDVVVPLAALDRAFGVERVIVSSYQATSGAGQPGVDELRLQVAKLADQIDALATSGAAGVLPDPSVFAAPIAFNVVPLVGALRDGGYTGEELKLMDESRKIMGRPDLLMTGTCVRVPTVVGHGASVYARLRGAANLDAVTQTLREAPGVEVVDVPNPLDASGNDACYVGRIRLDPGDANAVWFFSVSDNLRKGAALNAVQVAELLLP